MARMLTSLQWWEITGYCVALGLVVLAALMDKIGGPDSASERLSGIIATLGILGFLVVFTIGFVLRFVI